MSENIFSHSAPPMDTSEQVGFLEAHLKIAHAWALLVVTNSLNSPLRMYVE